MGNETHENLLREIFLTQIINKVCNEALFIHACVTLDFKRENGSKRFGVYFYCFSDNCCRATAGGNGSDPHLNPTTRSVIPSTNDGSISERIPTSNKICSLIPYLKHCGDLVWCLLGRTLTLCKRIISYP